MRLATIWESTFQHKLRLRKDYGSVEKKSKRQLKIALLYRGVYRLPPGDPATHRVGVLVGDPVPAKHAGYG